MGVYFLLPPLCDLQGLDSGSLHAELSRRLSAVHSILFVVS